MRTTLLGVLLGCHHPVVEMEAARVSGSGVAVEVTIPRGTLVQPDSRGGLERFRVDAPIQARLHEDGRLLGALDGRPFFALLEDGRPRVWLTGDQWLDVADGVQSGRVLVPAAVPVVAVSSEGLRVELPFEAPDGTPLTILVQPSQVTARRPAPPDPARPMGIYGELVHGRRFLLADKAGEPFARTDCGSARLGAEGVMVVRDGIEIAGPPADKGEACPDGGDELGLTQVPEGWTHTTRPIAERATYTNAMFSVGSVLYTAESGACTRWEVEARRDRTELVRRWEDETALYHQAIDISRVGPGAVVFERGGVREHRRVPLIPGIGMVGGDPVMLCGRMPVSIVDWHDDEVHMVRVYSQAEPLWAWPPDRPVELLFRTESACREHLGVQRVASLAGRWGCG